VYNQGYFATIKMNNKYVVEFELIAFVIVLHRKLALAVLSK